jgi:predicted metal-binding membrane protein
MVLLYARVARRAERKGQIQNAAACIAAFATGYLTLWILFSAFAVAAQWALEHSGAMSGMTVLRSRAVAGGLLIAAGLYQLTPLKESCLAHCRSPAEFLAAHWRGGVPGAWRMGLGHGVYCLGCCFALMLRVPLGVLLMIAGAALIAGV